MSLRSVLVDLISKRPLSTYYAERLERSLWDANGLSDILNREWIERTWNFQELLLANNIMIGCGQKWMAWEHFISGLTIAHFDIKSALDGNLITQNIEA